MAGGMIPKYADGADTGWVRLTNTGVFHPRTASDAYGLFIRKLGNVVTIIARQIQLDTELPAETYGSSVNLITNLDTKYRPAYTVNSFAGWPTNAGRTVTHVQITETGNITFFAPPQTTWPTNVSIDFTQTFLV